MPQAMGLPAQVLHALNAGFQMEDQQGRYLTMWYGVYQLSTRTLRYASAGHPPALLWAHQEGAKPIRLTGEGMALGLFADALYKSKSCYVDHNACLLIYSDGIYDTGQTSQDVWSFPVFVDLVQQCNTSLRAEEGLSQLVQEVQGRTGAADFTDDYSIIRALFP